MTDFPDLKIKALVNFPSQAVGRTGIRIEKDGGTFYADLDYSGFGIAASLPPGDIPNSYVLVYNSVTGAFVLVPVASIGGL